MQLVKALGTDDPAELAIKERALHNECFSLKRELIAIKIELRKGTAALSVLRQELKGKGGDVRHFREFALPESALAEYHEMMEPIETVAEAANRSNSRLPELPADRLRIVSTPGTCGGKPRIDGHRIRVEDVAIWHERMGMSPDEIVSAFPSITLSDVHAALAYYFENRERIDGEIRAGERFVEEMKAKAPPSLLQQKLGQRTLDASDDSVPPR